MSSIIPPLPHANSFVIGTAVINTHPGDDSLRLPGRKIDNYRQQYADNQNISFLSAIVSTSTRMHGEFLRRNHSDSFRFKRAAFYQSLKSKVGLAAAKAAALRMNLNVEDCVILAVPVHAPPRALLLLPLLLSHNLPLPGVH